MRNTIKYLLGASLMLSWIACEPVEHRNELSNSFSPEDIHLEVIQETEGSNAVTLKMLTPGVMGEWSYGVGTSQSDEVSFITPTIGKITCTYTVYNQYIENGDLTQLNRDIKKSIDVEVTKIDHSPGDYYNYLIGDDLKSKTWVFAGTPQDGGKWFYKCNPKDYTQVWWNMGGTTAGKPVDHAGEMTFDLDGGSNITYIAKPGDTPKKGTWNFNSDFTQFSTSGEGTILGAHAQLEAEPITIFKIAKLTDDELILLCTSLKSSPSDGWCWVFKPKAE